MDLVLVLIMVHNVLMEGIRISVTFLNFVLSSKHFTLCCYSNGSKSLWILRTHEHSPHKHAPAECFSGQVRPGVTGHAGVYTAGSSQGQSTVKKIRDQKSFIVLHQQIIISQLVLMSLSVFWDQQSSPGLELYLPADVDLPAACVLYIQ